MSLKNSGACYVTKLAFWNNIKMLKQWFALWIKFLRIEFSTTWSQKLDLCQHFNEHIMPWKSLSLPWETPRRGTSGSCTRSNFKYYKYVHIHIESKMDSESELIQGALICVAQKLAFDHLATESVLMSSSSVKKVRER